MRYGYHSGSALYGWCVRTAVCLFALLCPAQAASGAVSQSPPAVYDFERDRLPVVSLNGLWRFQAGDDPDGTKGWASPGFDDSSWRLVHSGKSWIDEPGAAFAGPAWFRARVVLPAGTTGLAVYLPTTFLNYQLYADGRLLGGMGPMPPDSTATITHPIVLPLPTIASASTVVLTLRVWRWPQWNYFYKFALPAGIQISEARLLEEKRESAAKEKAWDQVASILLLVADLVFGMAALVLFWLRRSEYANLWFGTMLVLTAASIGWDVWPYSHLTSIPKYYIVLQGFSSLIRLTQIFFYFEFFRGIRNWLFWFAVAAASLVAFADYPLFFPSFFPARFVVIPNIAWIGLISALQASPSLWIFTLLFQRAREGREDARLLLVPVILKQSAPILFFVSYWGYYGFFLRTTLLARLNKLSVWPFAFSFYDLGDGLFLVTAVRLMSCVPLASACCIDG